MSSPLSPPPAPAPPAAPVPMTTAPVPDPPTAVPAPLAESPTDVAMPESSTPGEMSIEEIDAWQQAAAAVGRFLVRKPGIGNQNEQAQQPGVVDQIIAPGPNPTSAPIPTGG